MNIVYWTQLCVWWLYLTFVFTFNLSPKHAVIFKDPTNLQGTYFGYSIALQKDESQLKWLVVGAPRGNSTLPSHLNITEPGVVYQCQLQGDMKCTPLLLDSAGNDRNDDIQYVQRKDHAWIGGSIDVQDVPKGQIIACGPRWKNDNDAGKGRRYMNGICYISSVPQSNESVKLMPLIARENKYYARREGDDPDVKEESYFYFYGQAGISTHFVKGIDELLIGAPGVLDWRGTVMRYKVNDYKNPVIPNPAKNQELKNYTYSGYSLGSGNFLSGKRNRTLYVTGAPRAGNKFQGKVFIFDINKPKNKDGEHRMDILKEFVGQESGEYFGASLSVGDINGDGLEDILVGAPRFAQKQAYDQGRIFVYFGKGNLTFQDKTIIRGSKQSGAQFGTAITILGDIDMDGYNDFAVGAPYDDSGRGVVYIYRGTKEGLTSSSPFLITGKEIDYKIMGFGISFSRGLDIDNNNYIDFAIGAHKSGQVVLIKSFPVVSFEARIYPNITSIGFNDTGFSITACLKYVGKYSPEKTDARVKITLDKQYQRVQFGDSNKWIDIFDIIIKKSEERCIRQQLIIKKKLQDFSKPIVLKMEYTLKSDPRENENFCKSCPVVDPSKSGAVSIQVPYTTGCKVSSNCRTDLVVTAEIINLKIPMIIGTESLVKVKTSVSNKGEPAFLAYLMITLPPECTASRVPSFCEIGVDVHPQSQLKCLLGNPLKENEIMTIFEVDISRVVPGTEDLLFTINAVSSGDEQLSKDNKKLLHIPVVTESDIGINGFANQEGIVHSRENETIGTETIFSHVYEVKNFGPSPLTRIHLEFKIPVSVADLEEFITIQSIETLHDNKPFFCRRSDRINYSRSLNMINLPKNVSQLQITTEGTPVSSAEKTLQFNDSMTHSTEIPLVKTRSHANADVFPGEIHVSKERVLTITCADRDTTCVTVSCDINAPIANQSRSIVVFSMTANFKIVEPIMNDADIIVFLTSGKATITEPTNVLQTTDERPNEATVQTTFHGKVKAGKLNYAILGIAAGASFLVLLIVIIVLWKMGFFKRKKPHERYRALKQTNTDD